MAENESKASIRVEAKVDQAVRELQRLGVVADTALSPRARAFSTSTPLEEQINALRRERLLSEGFAKEELSRKLVNPAQFKALGEEARERFNQGMVGLLSDLNPNDSNFFDKFIQITKNMSGPINEKAIKEGSDRSLQRVNKFLEEAEARVKAGRARISTEFSAGMFDKKEFDRQKVLLDQAFNQELLGALRVNQKHLSGQALQRMGEAFKIIDPAKIRAASDSGLNEARNFVEGIQNMFSTRRGYLTEQLAKKVINPEDFDRELRKTKDIANKRVTDMINEMATGGRLTPQSRSVLQDALFKISPERAAKSADEGLAVARKALDQFEADYRQKRAKIREQFGGRGGQENEANLIRQTSVAQSELNKRIMEQIALQRQSGNLSDRALHTLTGGLKIVNPKTVREAHDQGLQLAESLLRPIEDQFKKRMSSIEFQRAAGRLSSREIAQMQVGAATAKNSAIRDILNQLGTPDAAGQVRLTADAFNKLAGSLVNVDQFARHAHTSMHQLRSRIFDFLAVFAAVNFVERAVMNVVQAFNQLRAMGEEVARDEGVERAFTRSAAALKGSSEEILNLSRGATRGVVEDFELMKATNMATSLQAVKSAEDLRKLMFAGRTMARVIGIDATRGVNDLTIALARGSTRVLDNIGVILKVEQAQRLYAQQLGKTTDALTEKEKREAFAVIGLQKAYERALQFGDAEDSAAERTARLNANLANQARELKATMVATQSFQTVVNEISESLDDKEHGIVRWLEAIINSLDHIITVSFNALKAINLLDVAARNAARAWLDLKGIWEGKGTVDEQASVFDDRIAALQTQAEQLRNLSMQGIIDPSTAMEGIDLVFAQIEKLKKERADLLKPVEITPVTDWFLDKFAPMDEKKIWNFLHSTPLIDDGDGETSEDKAKRDSERIQRLIGLYRDFTEQGRDTAHIVRLLTTEFGLVKGQVDSLGTSTDAVIASYASMQTALRSALDNVSFDHFEQTAKASIDRFRQLVELGQMSPDVYNNLQGTLARVNELLAQQGALTDENRVKALRLQNDAKEALVDAPLRQLDREARDVLNILGQLNEQRLSGTEEYESRLHVLRDAVENLGRVQSGLLTDDQVARIRRLAGEIQQYFNETPVKRLNSELQDMMGMLQAQETLGINNVAVEEQLIDLRRRYNEELARRGVSSDPRRTELLRGLGEIEQFFRRRRDIETRMTGEILTSQKRVRESAVIDLRTQIDEYERQGINRVVLEQWVQEQLIGIRRQELQDVESIAMNVASAIGDTMFLLGQNVEDLSDKLRDLSANLLRAFANIAIQRGLEKIVDDIARLSVGAADASSATGSGLLTSTAGKTASAAATAATSAGATAALASTGVPGMALLAGGFALSLLGGILNRDRRDDEEAQYRAHLRALRQDRAEQMVNLTIILPDKPINPRDREWQQTLRDTIVAGQESRLIGSLQIQGGNG